MIDMHVINKASHHNKPCEIHIVNPFLNPAGGSENRGLSLYRVLKDIANVYLWSESIPHELLLQKYPINTISNSHYPVHGTFIFIGVYFKIGFWFAFAKPTKIILIYNTQESKKFYKRYMYLSVLSCSKPLVVFSCESLKHTININGYVEPSVIDITRFYLPINRINNKTFVIGRLSRDVLYKHNVDDIALYEKLASEGAYIKIMGGTCLQNHIGQCRNIELLPSCSYDAVEFLHGLDCFYYRVSPGWYETFGRVIFEAMACGIPVVCENRGGYCSYIEHGINGFLVNSAAEAYAIIIKLKQDTALRQSVGKAARASIEKIYSDTYTENLKRFYLA